MHSRSVYMLTGVNSHAERFKISQVAWCGGGMAALYALVILHLGLSYFGLITVEKILGLTAIIIPELFSHCRKK